MNYLKNLSFVVGAGYLMIVNPVECSNPVSLPSFQELDTTITAAHLTKRFRQSPLPPLPVAQPQLPDFQPYAVVATTSYDLQSRLSRCVSQTAKREMTFVVEDAEAIATGKSPQRQRGRKPNIEQQAPGMWAILVPPKPFEEPVRKKRSRLVSQKPVEAPVRKKRARKRMIDYTKTWQSYQPKPAATPHKTHDSLSGVQS